ncbi:MAG: polysaccharide biosynthesis tyrosine autokinase [Nostoc sp. JL31]|uniref:GumC family protein n=1 Tax=Nostoc sp. JL31 TaxID=2815395 RepID=UPI0025D13589|nr:polysaccharide biosynthesis tyrosine autokinase [Nostoc sp. JL31]MBN3888724.1 polysaccharide biosynthesis tyrosine autokinase [Nostoc sp. JL31]
MEKSISSLLAISKRRSLPALATFIATLGTSVAYLAVAPHWYETSARLMLDEKRVSLSELGRDLTQVPSGTAGGPSPLADQAEFVKSQPVLEKAIVQVKNDLPQNQLTVSEIRRGLKVKIVPATNILELTYQGRDPNFAAELVNAISQTMVEENAKAISSEATKVRVFLQKEVPLARQILQRAEIAENRYRQKSGIISIDDQTKSLVLSLANLEDQERTLVAQLQEAKSRDISLRQITDAKTINNAYASVRSGQDEQVKNLRTKLADLETQIIQTRLRFTENNPTLIKLIEQRDAIRALYTQELARVSPGNATIPPSKVASDSLSQELRSKLIVNEIERLAIENKLKSVQSLQANLQTRLAQLPIKELPLSALARQRQQAATSLNMLQSKLEEARIAEAQKVSNIRIIEEAQPPTSPTSPKKAAVLVIATFFGAILAIGVVLLLELMDNRLHDGSEVEELLKLPVLGVLPRLPVTMLNLEPSEQFLDDVALVEPYRMLLKTLEFRSTHKPRVIVVSSSISGEGKSVVVSHLAAVSAMLSRRTLIIDADLHIPVQHRLFHLAANPGITEVISGNKTLLEAVQRTDIKNLSILTCGELHTRPSQLLESAAIESLIAEAATKYDLVIIDTAAISDFADAATLTQQSDGVIIVTRPSFTHKGVLQKSVSELTENRISILGVVVNGIKNQTRKSYHYPRQDYQAQFRPKKHLTYLESPLNHSARNQISMSSKGLKNGQ